MAVGSAESVMLCFLSDRHYRFKVSGFSQQEANHKFRLLLPVLETLGKDQEVPFFTKSYQPMLFLTV